MRRVRFNRGSVIASAAMLVPVAASSHHSRAVFDTKQEVVVEGTVTKLDWRNPHIYFTVETKSPGGQPLLQAIEATSVSEAQALGLNKDAIAPGARLWEGRTLVIDTVGFAPYQLGLVMMRSSPAKHLVERLTLADDRRHLRYAFTVEDPEYLAAPASYTATWDYRPDLEPSGEPCDPETARRPLTK